MARPLAPAFALGSFVAAAIPSSVAGAIPSMVAAAAPSPVAPPGATSPPRRPPASWLALSPGVAARVDLAPWYDSDEPEAALVASPATLARDFGANAARPDDVVYEPVGVRVRLVRVLPGGRIALVRGRDARFSAYAPVERLVPEVPAGTPLLAAGGFAGFADFFPALDTRYGRALRLATGSTLVAESIAAAPYDPDTSDLVRIRVRVTSGNLRGRTGWVAVVYTGLPEARPSPHAAVAERACRCRIVAFDSPS